MRGLRELREIGLVDGELPRVYAAQAAGCAPVVTRARSGLEHPEPVRPDTIAKSIAIGNPADGYQVIQAVKTTGGTGAAVTDEQIVDAIRLLAETEGIFTEPAGGTTLAAAVDLIRRGTIPRDEIDCRVRDRERLQDRGSGREPADAAGEAESDRSRNSRPGTRSSATARSSVENTHSRRLVAG